jgi:hypothetical protein
VIVPLNFVSSIRKADVELRGFLAEFAIRTMNVFEERCSTTPPTPCAASSFRERPRRRQRPRPSRYGFTYPSRKTMSVELTPENNYTIGGEIYNLPRNDA